MPKIHFNRRHKGTESRRFWNWRELNRHSQQAADADAEQAQAFAAQAQQIAEQIEFLLGGGLSDGAQEVLATLAEEDMVNFCIMVDLAEPIDLPGVTPLQIDTRQHLQHFLDGEPWHSLAIDHDITIALALLDSVGTQSADTRWYRYAPGLFNLVARLADQVNKEQLLRFVGEYNALVQRDHIRLSDDAQDIFATLVNGAAHRVGLPDQGLDRS